MARKKVAAPKKSAVKKSGKVSAEEFCKAWAKHAEQEKTLDELAQSLGMEKSAIQARRSNYATNLGLKFPKLARSNKGPRLDKGALQKILSGHPL